MKFASSRNEVRPATLNQVQRRIDELRSINLENADIEYLKRQLTLLFTGFTVSAPILDLGQRLYRGIKWQNKPTNKKELSYPPKHFVNSHQRANRANQPRFYCSIGRPTPFFELSLEADSYVAISQWEVAKKFCAYPVGYSKEVFKKLESLRDESAYWWDSLPFIFETPANKLVAEFLNSEFTKPVTVGLEHYYKISIAIAEKISGFPLKKSDSLGARMPGLIYPSIGMFANSDNLVLLPEIIDEHLRLVDVEYLHVTACGDKKYEIEKVDFANSFKSDGTIEWQGRRPQWKLKPSEEMKISVENNELVAHTLDGKRIDPV